MTNKQRSRNSNGRKYPLRQKSQLKPNWLALSYRPLTSPLTPPPLSPHPAPDRYPLIPHPPIPKPSFSICTDLLSPQTCWSKSRLTTTRHGHVADRVNTVSTLSPTKQTTNSGSPLILAVLFSPPFFFFFFFNM